MAFDERVIEEFRRKVYAKRVKGFVEAFEEMFDKMSWHHPNWNSARRIELLRAWWGFARLFYPEGFDRGAFDHELWLELEVYWDLTVKGAWKEGGENDPLVVRG